MNQKRKTKCLHHIKSLVNISLRIQKRNENENLKLGWYYIHIFNTNLNACMLTKPDWEDREIYILHIYCMYCLVSVYASVIIHLIRSCRLYNYFIMTKRQMKLSNSSISQIVFSASVVVYDKYLPYRGLCQDMCIGYIVYYVKLDTKPNNQRKLYKIYIACYISYLFG